MVESKEPAVVLAVEQGIARITLNRPESGNAIGPDFIEAFDEVTLQCSERDDIRALMLLSTGPRFCVGGNIQDMPTGEGEQSLSFYIRKCNAILQGCLARLRHMAAPSVAVVQGVVAGGGLSIAAACDIVVASEQARLVAAYAGIGFCPDLGGSSVLAHRMGVARAQRFYLLQEKLDAQTAAQIGLVDIMVAPAELLATAESIAQRWATGPTAAYAETRRLMRSAGQLPYEAQMELETQSLAKLAGSADAAEALAAFIEKRVPKFRGR